MRAMEGTDEEALWRGIRESTPQFLRDAGKRRGPACFVRALRRGARAGVIAVAGRRSRGLGRLLWLLRAGSDLTIIADPAGTSVVEFAPQEFREENGVPNEELGRGRETILR